MISEKVIRIATREGFLEEFWKDLSDRRARGEKVTHQDVYAELNQLYYMAFGSPIFNTFSAFRSYRDRKMKKGANAHR